MDEELDALLRHAEALTEVISCNSEGSPEDFLESIADQGPVEAKPRPPAPPQAETPEPPATNEEPPAMVDEPTVAQDDTPPETASPDTELSDRISEEADSATISEADASADLIDDTYAEAEIDSILQEAGEAIERGVSDDIPPRDLPDLLNDPDQSDPADEAVAETVSESPDTDVTSDPEANVEVLYIPDDEQAPEASPPIEESAEAIEVDSTPPAPDEVDEAEPESAAVAETAEAPTEPEPADDATAVEDEAKPTFVARWTAVVGKIIGGSRTGVRALLRTPHGAIRLLGRVLSVINAPFEKLSDRSRDIIGIIAIATLICGALAWVLPWLLTSNPFEQIPPGIVTDR